MAKKSDKDTAVAKKEAADAKNEAAAAKKNTFTTTGGRVIESKIVHGKKTNRSAEEQGQLARGEIDGSGEPTGKKAETPADGTRTVKTGETLYVGNFTLHATAGATGEKVSVLVDQAEPTTEDGLFYHLQQYHPSAIRDTFEIDAENETDPTLRTSLEK